MRSGGNGASGEQVVHTVLAQFPEADVRVVTKAYVRTRPELEAVVADAAADQGIARPVMIEVDAEPKNPYVQQKVIYTVRVLMAAPLRDVTLSEPGINDALVHPLGQERRYETYRQGRQFQAVERQYAVQPQLSGSLKIAGPLLTGRISDPSSAGNNPRSRLFGNDPFSNL
mgnify:CR=1 FL=1